MDKSHHAHDKAGGGHGVGVGGRLRQRLAQILRHSSCATTSATAFVGVATTTNAAPPATVVTTNAASLQEPPPPRCAHEPQPTLSHGGRCHRRRSSRALVHISIDCSTRSVGAAVLPSSPAPARDAARDVKSGITRKKGSGGNKLSSLLYSWSSSSDTDDELAPFSSDGERGQATTDTRSTIFSSRSFSSDSTVDFYNATGSSTRSRRRRHKNTPPRRAPKPGGGAFRPTKASAAAGKHEKENKKQQQVDREDGGSVSAAAAAGSTAVVKRSHNPYADFRRSMVEMVSSRRRLRGADALSELLVWYLSLNSPQHHPAILAAFEDVWEAVLSNDDRPRSIDRSR